MCDRPEGRAKDSLEEGLERGNHAPHNEIVSLRECGDDKVPRNYRGRVIEDYVRARTKIHFHLLAWVFGLQAQPRYYCLTFQYAGEELDISPRPKRVDDISVEGGVEHKGQGGMANRMNEAVLVDVRQFPENPEVMGAILVPSVIRLQPLDFCLRQWVNASDLAEIAPVVPNIEPAGRLPLPVFIPNDWELRDTLVLLANRLSLPFRIRDGEFKGEMIEDAAQILDAITDKEPEGVEGRGVDVDLYKEITGALRVRLGDGLTFNLVSVVGLPLKLLQVVIRPAKL